MLTLHIPVLAAADAKFADISVSAWVWIGFVALLAGLLAIDLVLHRDNHAPSAKRALVESAAWVACGLAFAVVVLLAWGGQAFGEYLSGYVIEKSLSIDNVFVWAIIFSTFAIPARYQHRVLFWGIFGALTLRAVFILGGSALITRFWWMLPVFGLVLLVSGIKVIRHRDDEGTQGHDRAVKLLGRFVPVRDDAFGPALPAPRGREMGGDAVARRARRDRGDRRRVRGRQRAGDPRGVARAVHRVRVERVRDPRPPRHVLPARRRTRAVPLPLARARGHPHLRGREDGRLALVPHAHRAVARR